MVATRRQEHVEDAASSDVVVVRRGGRDRKPVQPYTATIEIEPLLNAKNSFSRSKFSFGNSNSNNRNGRKVSPSLGWTQLRKEQQRKIQLQQQQKNHDKRRKTIPTTLIDPYTGKTVYIQTATLQDIATAQKKQKPPYPLSTCSQYLVLIPSVQQRQIVYDRAAAAIAELEQRLLPSYGGRLQWKCIVTIKETSTTTTTNNNKRATTGSPSTGSNKKSPYFIWNKRGQLELAAFPYMIEKIPNPPHFPGYYKNGTTASTSKRKTTTTTRAASTTNRINCTKGKEMVSAVNNNDVNASPPTTTTTAGIDDDNDHAVDNGVVVSNQIILEVYDVSTDRNEILNNTVVAELPESSNSTAGINHMDPKLVAAAAAAAASEDPPLDGITTAAVDDDETDKTNITNVVQNDDNDIEEEIDDDEDEDEEDESLSDEMILLRELQERAISGLSELAFDERWRVGIPTVHYKWISPLQQTFYTRKSAWEHAIELCKNDVLLEKVLLGVGANGKLIKPNVPTQSTTFNAGKLRFIRDGLWIIGQEEQWIHEQRRHQSQQQEIDDGQNEKTNVVLDQNVKQCESFTNTSATITEITHGTTNIGTVEPRQRPWTGLSWFIHTTRNQFRQQRLKEKLEQQKALSCSISPSIHVVSPPPSMTTATSSSKNSDTDSLSSSVSTNAVEPVTTIATSSCMMQTPPPKRQEQQRRSDTMVLKYRLLDAAKDLRTIWKSMTEGEKLNWNNDAIVQNEQNSAVLDVPVSSPSGKSTVDTKLTNVSGKKKVVDLHRSKKWSLNEQQIKLCYDAGMDHYDQIMRTVTARDLFRELEDGFDLLRERGKGRWDMNIPEFDSIDYSFLNDTKKSPWMPVVKEILGKDAVLIHKGIFLSMPGSSKQVYHQDGPHLTTQYQKPCHAINVFVPLVDLALDNGPTEFCLGSHILDYDDLDEDFVTIPTVSAGTPIIFDYRLGHRGLGNSSNLCRPIVYCTYAASADGKEFHDSVNFSRKRYHRIGDLVEKGLTRAERAEKRQRP